MRKLKIGIAEADASFDMTDVAEIRAKTPVVTGNLRDGFRIDLDGNIENEVDYADEVEFGTHKSPGRFMVHQSIDTIANRLVGRINRQFATKKLLNDITIKVKF